MAWSIGSACSRGSTPRFRQSYGSPGRRGLARRRWRQATSRRASGRRSGTSWTPTTPIRRTSFIFSRTPRRASGCAGRAAAAAGGGILRQHRGFRAAVFSRAVRAAAGEQRGGARQLPGRRRNGVRRGRARGAGAGAGRVSGHRPLSHGSAGHSGAPRGEPSHRRHPRRRAAADRGRGRTASVHAPGTRPERVHRAPRAVGRLGGRSRADGGARQATRR